MVMEIPLTQGRVALVDDEDYPTLSKYKWHYTNQGYAQRYIQATRSYIRMHNDIMNGELWVDHKNGDKLNNCRSNLRSKGQSTNAYNWARKQRKLPRGVFPNHKRFMAKMRINFRQVYIGTYDTPEEASMAYREASFQHHGFYPPE